MTDTYRQVRLGREILEAALHRAESLPVFEGSHRKKQANVVGCIGEIIFERLLESQGIKYVDNRESTRHDYLVSGAVTVDVKTKDRTVSPKLYYDNSVPLYNHSHQKPDYYYFISLLRDASLANDDIRRFKQGFLLGGIDRGTLDRAGTTWNAGDTDPSNGTTFWTACINVGMRDLRSNSEMLDIFRTVGR